MGKTKAAFRNYSNSNRQEVVQRHYKLMRQNQTVEYVRRMEKKYFSFKNAKMTVREAFDLLAGYVDTSDPDTAAPNIEHDLQTAEAIRKAGYPDWMQLVGLLHDFGKIMFLWGNQADGQQGTNDGDQWGLGGDTWVVGCRIPDSVVFAEFNSLNPDMANPKYNTKYGMYKPNCGLKNLMFAFGHDEYMYRMLVHNKAKIPEQGLAMVRYHSCYPWHRENEYQHFMAPGDDELKKWVLEFNKFDLYTKADNPPEIDKLWPYYQSLIDKYLPGKLDW